MASKRISQKVLSGIARQRARIESLQKQLEKAEAEIFESLKAGATVDQGLLVAFIKPWERRSPAWKQVCERELGAEYCARVLAATKPDTGERLVIDLA